MDADKSSTGCKEKVDLQSCKRLMMLAQYRIEQSDLHEALAVLQEALRLANPRDYGSELLSQILRLRCQLCLEASQVLLKMGRPQRARKFAEEAIDIERENSKAACLITRLRQLSVDQLPPPTEQAV